MRSRINLIVFGYVAACFFWMAATYTGLAFLHISRWPLAIDFMHTYKNAWMLINDPHSICSTAAHTHWLNKISYPAIINFPVPSHYPLSVYILSLPLLLFSPPWALVLWLVLSGVIGVLSIWKLRDADGVLGKVAFMVLAFSSFPSVHTFWLGQLAWIYFGAITWFYFLLKQQNRFIMPAACFLLGLKLQYLAVLLPALFHRRWIPTLIVLATISIIFFTLAAYWIGLPTLLAYPVFASQYDPKASEMASLRGVATLLLGYDAGCAIGVASSVLGILVCLWLWLQWGKRTELIAWLMSLAILIALISNMHIFPYDSLLLMFIACATLPPGAPAKVFEPRAWTCPYYRSWSFLLLLYPFISWICFLFSSSILHSMSVYAICCLSVNIVLLFLGYRHLVQGSQVVSGDA